MARRVRPTLTVLRSLTEGWDPPNFKHQLNAVHPSEWPDLADLPHPVFAAAAADMPNGETQTCKLHESSTHAAGRKVWEVRDLHTGPGWRGAVVYDDDGDPWLVYAGTHHSFHRKARTYLQKSNAALYLPTDADYRLRDLEDAKHAVQRWESTTVRAVLEGLATAIRTPGLVDILLPELPTGQQPHVQIEVSGDEAEVCTLTPDTLHDTAADTHVVLWIVPVDWAQLQPLVGLIVPLFESDPGRVDPNYTASGRRMVLNFAVPHSRIAQLLAATLGTDDARRSHAHSPHVPTVAHYADRNTSMRAYVTGEILRSVCGVYFVPTQDPSGLPICTSCESLEPIAEMLIRLRRAATQRRN